MVGRAGEWAPGWGRGGTCLGRRLGGGGPGLPAGLVQGLTRLLLLQIWGSGGGASTFFLQSAKEASQE